MRSVSPMPSQSRSICRRTVSSKRSVRSLHGSTRMARSPSRNLPQSEMAFRSEIIGCGGYLPEKIVTNADLAERLATSDEWIVQRTGIRQRHVAAVGELTSDLATSAARQALKSAGMAGGDLDLIVL